MSSSSHQLFRSQRLLTCIALLCILLVGITAIGEASHSHRAQKDSGNCAICLAAHHSPGKTVVGFQPAFARALICHLIIPSDEPAFSTDLPFSLSVRPPPSV